MNCLYENNRLCLDAHKVTDFNIDNMKNHCLNCQSHELSTIERLFRLKTSNWTAEGKIEFALALWEGGNVNLLDLSEQQIKDLIRIIRKRLPNFLPNEK